MANLKMLVALLLLSSGLWAADPSKRFLALKDDADSYVGEGVAEYKEFKGDGLKALAAAKERALGSLASSIQVRVKSEVQEAADSHGGQTITARTESLAEVILDGVRYEEFVDFPKHGLISVLAWVTKEQYRRGLAGLKPPVYRQQMGFKIGLGPMVISSLKPIMESVLYYVSPGGIRGTVDRGEPAIAYNAEFGYRGWTVGVLTWSHPMDTYDYSGSSSSLGKHDYQFNLQMLQLGYDLAPWSWRVQPYLPMRLEGSIVSLGPYGTSLASATAGLGLRFWATESLILEVAGSYRLPLSQGPLMKGSEKFHMAPDAYPDVSLQGAQAIAGLRWSGF